MAHEELVVRLAPLFRRLVFFEPLFRALEVAAVREHLDRDDEAIAFRRSTEARDVKRQLRDLGRLAAAGAEIPDLGGAGAR